MDELDINGNHLIFFSDVHLLLDQDSAERKKIDRLSAFLEGIPDSGCRNVFILGDLFDFWFEWYHVIPKYWFAVLFKLRRLVDSGVNVFFINGNHDFYSGKFLAEQLGVQPVGENLDFQVGSRRFFVAHGDGLAKGDRGYRFLKKIIRNRMSIFLYKTFLSADLGIQIARMASHSSRTLQRKDVTSWGDEYWQFARKKFAAGTDYVILGHIHSPAIRRQENNCYVNCGDWLNHFSYAEYDGSRLNLKYWDRA